jgi:hypothetical protein
VPHIILGGRSLIQELCGVVVALLVLKLQLECFKMALMSQITRAIRKVTHGELRNIFTSKNNEADAEKNR